MNGTRHVARAVVLVIVALSIAACEEEPTQKVERIRAIKPYYVVEPVGGGVHYYSGTVKASVTSALSFAVAGTVQDVSVRKGDRVAKGQLMASLDPKPFYLRLQAAQAEQAAALAELQNKQEEADRQRQLLERGWVAKAAHDNALTAFESAREQLNLARSRLGLAERDHAKTKLKAPFEGVIAERDVEPFVEVAQGNPVFRLYAKGAYEVEIEVPDTVVARLSIGVPVTVEARAVAGCGCSARITEMGVVSGAANAVTVTATILEGPDGLLPGISVEAGIVLADDDDGGQGFLVPLIAIAPGDGAAMGYVFKFDEQTGTVRKTPVRGDGGASGNLVGATEGVSAGDIIAAAGVSFLRDGQRVKLMGQ
jgi:RND family efflux transporter MFP subunit